MQAAKVTALLILSGALMYDAPAETLNPVWSPGGSMQVARQNFIAVRLSNGHVLVAGGFASFMRPAGELLRSVAYAEIYNPVTNTWSHRAAMTEVRNEPAANRLQDGRILVTGGSYSMTAELYDPVANTWTPVAPMSDSRQGHTATLLPDGRVFVAGGFSGSGNVISAEIYDPVNNSWTPVANMIDARSDHAATLLADGRVLVVGGSGQASLGRRAEIYDPVTDTWTATADLASRRYEATATLLADGRVIVVGGQTSVAEILNPDTGVWTPGASASQSRKDHTATVLLNGQILYTGGDGPGSNDELATTEIYDPASGVWLPAPSLAQARTRHAAILLANGEVLVTGGATFGSDCCLATAERFGFGPGPVEFVVDTTTDSVDVLPGDGLCSDGAACSLRAAIMESNALPGQNLVTLPAGHYTLTLQGTTAGQENGDLDVLGALELRGAGARQTIVDAARIDRVFSVGSGHIVSLRNISMVNGLSASLGGGIYNDGVLSIYDSAIRFNRSVSTFGGGGGVYSTGQLNLYGVTLSANIAIVGGGISNRGTLQIFNSTFSGNIASPVSQQTQGGAPSRGGAIINDDLFASTTLYYSTVTANRATVAGGGIVNTCGPELCSSFTLTRSIVTANFAPDSPDCVSEAGSFGTGLRSDDYNLVRDVSGCPFTARPGDLIGIDATLAPLGNYGGPTRTHALLPGSLARDHVPLADCVVAFDQRRVPRPQGSACDIGAFEATTQP